MDVSQKLSGTLGALNQVSPEVFEAIDLGCAALWSSYHQSVLAAGWPVNSGASAASACYEVTVARTRLDRNSVGLMCRRVCSSRTQVAVGTRDVRPVDYRHKGVDIGGGSGWVLLTWSTRDRKLVNQWAMDHTTTLAGGQPILALDMYEHSYHMDYGARAAAYVDAFMAAINWPNVARAYGELRP